jgi:uncharacterized protein (TIGR03437 family)
VQPMMHRLRQFISRYGPFLLSLVAVFPASLQAQTSWNFLGPAGVPSRVVMVAVDPRNDSTIYVVASGGGISKTSDSGANWTPLTDSLATLEFCSVALDPQAPDVVYAGTGDNQSPRPSQTVLRSADGGKTWTAPGRFTNQPVCALAVDPSNSSRVVAGSGEGLFLSEDAGSTWNKVAATSVTSIAFDSAGNVYAGVLGDDLPGVRDHILIRSSDNGHTWTSISLPVSGLDLTLKTTSVSVAANPNSLAVTVSYEQTPFFPGSSASATSPLSFLDFYRSTDNGMTWTTVTRIGDARPPTQLVTDPVTGNIYVAANKLLASRSQGVSWVTISTATSDFHSVVLTRGMLLLGGEKGLEIVSPVDGITPPSIAPLSSGQFLGISLDSHNAVWAAGPSGLFGPDSRSNLANVAGIGSAGVVAATATLTNIYVSGNQHISISTDGGTTFSSSAVLASGELRAPLPPLVADPVNNASAYVAGTHVYHTTNSGQAWTALPVVDSDATHVVVALAMAPAQRTTLYAATACLPEVIGKTCPLTISWIWLSRNSGQSWTQMGTVSGFVNRLAVDPRQTNTVYAAIGAFAGGPSLAAGYVQGDLQQSTNGGTTWVSIRANLPNVPINAVVIDPTSLPSLVITFPTGPPTPGQPFGPIVFNQPAQTLYVATDAGVFVTFNLGGGGNNAPTPLWSDISFGLPPSPVTDITLKQPAGILVVSTFGHGVYSRSVTGLAAGIVANPLSIDVTLIQGAAMTTGVPLTNLSTSSTLTWRLNPYDSWLGLPVTNGSLRPRASGQAAVRISAEKLGKGTYVGRLQLLSSGSFTQTVFITAHVTGAPAQMTIVGGNNGVGAVGTTLPPLEVMVSDGNQNPLFGVPVLFTVSAGGGSASPQTAYTNDAGIASTVLTLPSSPGSVRVTAANGSLLVQFSETAVLAPALTADGVVDGVTLNPYTPLAPGSIVSISGQSLSQVMIGASAGNLPSVLDSTRVRLIGDAGNIALPLFLVTPTQIRALIPTDTLPGTYRLRVESASSQSNDIQISVAAFGPGIVSQNGTGHGLGVFVKDDRSVVSASNPADRGAIITFFADGLGPVNPAVAAGQAGATAEPYNRTVTAPRVFFDIYPADLIYSGLPAGAPGPYQVTVRVPAQVSPAENISVSLTIGGFASNRVTIPVR